MHFLTTTLEKAASLQNIRVADRARGNKLGNCFSIEKTKSHFETIISIDLEQIALQKPVCDKENAVKFEKHQLK